MGSRYVTAEASVITAVDSSVLLDVFAADPAWVEGSALVLRQAIATGALVACDVVWAELRPCFPDRVILERAMTQLAVGYAAPTQQAACLAGEAWARYRQAGGPRDHLIPDFLVAAHACQQADRLLTRDRGFYRKWFADLPLLQPKQPSP